MSSEPRPNYGRNWRYEEWLITIGAASGDLEALRAAEREELEALARDKGCSIDPDPEPKSEPASTSWLSNITPTMVARAGRRPAVSHASRAELLHGPSRSTSASDRFGGHITDYGDLVSRGGKR
jgi:hypothetical protein